VAYNRVAILGTGLIGASVGLALKASRQQTQIIGYDASGDSLRRAQGVKAIDRRGSLRDALENAELVLPDRPGLGLTFNQRTIERFVVAG